MLSDENNFNPRPREGDDDFVPIWLTKINIFQSTSPRGGRPSYVTRDGSSWAFQSTSPRGGRLQDVNHNQRRHAISIHVPARGTTSSSSSSSVTTSDFNPRPREGDDNGKAVNVSNLRYFNPRPREGDDFDAQGNMRPLNISIHVPARGTTTNR